MKKKNSPTGMRWWKPAQGLFGSQRGTWDQDTTTAAGTLVPGASAPHAPQTTDATNPNAKTVVTGDTTTRLCLLCGKPIPAGQHTVTVFKLRPGYQPTRPPGAPAHPECFRAEVFRRNW